MPGARVERACPAFQTGALTATASLANLVEEEGFEPFDHNEAAKVALSGDKVCHGSSLLINRVRPSGPPVERLLQNWLRAGELNATRMAYEASMTPVHLPAINKTGAGAENRTPLIGQAIRRPTNRPRPLKTHSNVKDRRRSLPGTGIGGRGSVKTAKMAGGFVKAHL